MKLFCTDHWTFPLPAGHRFPFEKYQRLRERVQGGGERHWSFHPASRADDDAILRVHTRDYWDRARLGRLDPAEIRRLGLPWSQELFLRSLHSAGGTLDACRAALEEGVAVNLAGGTHHAFADQPEGFCMFNDSVIAARTLQTEGLVKRIAVIDCDVHQGNGTASLVAGDTTIFAFSIHGAKNFPFRKVPGHLDLALPDRTEDDDYLAALRVGVEHAFKVSAPDLVIYLAGADPFVGDRFSRWCVTKQGLRQRDELVLSACRRRDVPVAVTMAGGYAKFIDDTVDIHEQTVRVASEFWHGPVPRETSHAPEAST